MLSEPHVRANRAATATALVCLWLIRPALAAPQQENPAPQRSIVGSATLQVSPRTPNPGSGPGFRDRTVYQGIAVDVSIEPLEPQSQPEGVLREGNDALFRFRISDTTTHSPLSGVFPAAWMDHLVRGIENDAQRCEEKVEEFVGGSIFSQAELDLNVYYVLALNEDATITVVDPLFGFGGTKLLAMIMLESPGEDWVLTEDRRRLFVSMPAAGKIAVADTGSWKVTANLDVGAARLRRVALQPDGQYLWVTFSGEDPNKASGVVVFDAETLTRIAQIDTGRGQHEIVFSPNSRWAFVTNRVDGTLNVIDVRELKSVASVETGDGPVSLAYSPLGEAAYISNEGDGTVSVVDAKSRRVVKQIDVDPGVGQIRFAPGGRLAFAVNPKENVFYVIDGALNRVVQTGDVEAGPDHVAFSDENAFIRQRGSEIVWMTPLDAIGNEGDPVSIIDLPAGQRPFSAGVAPSPADTIVQAPGANAVLVANPADRAIYYYKEGMAAPMGHFQNYGRQPRAVLVVDRSLKERSPGSYETFAKLRRPGRYALAFYLDSPFFVHCFDVTVEADPELAAARRRQGRARVEYVGDARPVSVGEMFPLRIKLTDSISGEPKTDLRDVHVLAYKSPGTRQHRLLADVVGPGVYEAKGTSGNKYTSRTRARKDRVVPLAVEVIALDADLLHLLVRHLDPFRIAVVVELALHPQAFPGRGRCNEVDDHLVTNQWLAAPVLTDKREQAMLNLVPLARPRWKVAYRNAQAEFVGKLLQFHLPESNARPIAAPRIGGNEQSLGPRIDRLPH